MTRKLSSVGQRFRHLSSLRLIILANNRDERTVWSREILAILSSGPKHDAVGPTLLKLDDKRS